MSKIKPLLCSVISLVALGQILFAQQPSVQQHGKSNQAAGTNNGVMNQGPCNVTVVNPKSPVIQVIGCNLAGLSAEQQAAQLKRLLTTARQNGITLERIYAEVAKLAAQPKSLNVQQSVEEGVANSGTISAPLTFNDNRQYGRPSPPPRVTVLKSFPVQGYVRPLPRPEGLPDADWNSLQSKVIDEAFGEDFLTENPGHQFVIGVERSFSNPKFLIKCDHPCAIAYSYTPDGNVLSRGGGLPANEFTVNPDYPNMLVLQVESPPTLAPGHYLVVKIRSLDYRPVKASIESYADPLP